MSSEQATAAATGATEEALQPAATEQPVPQPRPPEELPARKRIKTAADMRVWQSSEAYRDLRAFIEGLATKVQGMCNTAPEGVEPCPCLAAVISALETMSGWVDEIPLQDLQHQRFGNKAFRDLHSRLREHAQEHMTAALHAGGGDTALAPELAVYWEDAFGNQTRIDFGTGHELHFCVVMMLLTRLGCIPEEQQPLIVTRAFIRYMQLARKLQSRYCMEPAGSHGVWGLDDFHHLPFLWGAAQLVGNPQGLEAKDLVRDAPKFRDLYLYHDGIAWILDNKRGPFHEHSPTLHSVCQLSWNRIMAGMAKMYIGEVLNKWPVVQHLPFGTLLQWPEAEAASGSPRHEAPMWSAGGIPGAFCSPTSPTPEAPASPPAQ